MGVEPARLLKTRQMFDSTTTAKTQKTSWDKIVLICVAIVFPLQSPVARSMCPHLRKSGPSDAFVPAFIGGSAGTIWRRIFTGLSPKYSFHPMVLNRDRVRMN